MIGRRERGWPRLDTAALYTAVQNRRTSDRLSLRELRHVVGDVSPSTFVRMGKGDQPSADALVRILLYLGTTDLAPFIDYGDQDTAGE